MRAPTPYHSMVDGDVLVVGAGLAGLRCAARLAAAGRTVDLIEAHGVVGGRQRTDEVDGFLLDRGFQVLNPAYPAVRRWVDVGALDLRPFGAGLDVRRRSGSVRLSHPLREPSGILPTLRSGLLSVTEVAALARWLGPALVAPGRLTTGADTSVREGLDRAGVRGPLRTEVIEPFFAGVVAEDTGETSDAFVRLLVRMFALGVPGLPARGIRALPEQLLHAALASPGEVTVRVGTRVEGVRSTSSGVEVAMAGGDVLRGRAVVVAVGPDAVADLVDVPPPGTKGLQTWWFASDEAPTPSTRIAVDGRRRGPMVNAAVVSNAVPSYSPRGRHLVQVTCLLGGGAAPASEHEVRRQAEEVLGGSSREWELLRRDDIRDALPEQRAPLRTTSPARVSERVYLAGDHRDTASIQGALVSGDRVGRAVLADLAP